MLIAVTSLALLIVGLPIAASVWMRRRSAGRTPASLDELPADARIVVLGCPARSRTGDPNRYFVSRISAAAAAYHHSESRSHRKIDGARSRVLCSGWDAHGEATELAEALIAAGVASERLSVDGRAARTIDSIDYVAIQHADEKIVFVSQAFHLPRVLFLARSRGLDAWALRAEGRLHGLRPRLRETFARLRSIIDLGLRSGPR